MAGLIPLTAPDVRRLLLLLALPFRLPWSHGRRPRHAEARQSHYQRRLGRNVSL